MSIRYYPASKIKPNKVTKGGEFHIDGNEYKGNYYETFDGKFFSGANPIIGSNKRLKKISAYDSDYLNQTPMKQSVKQQFAKNNKDKFSQSVQTEITIPGVAIPPPRFKGEPTSYFPATIPEDYQMGFITRYFAKRVNSKGYVVEIAEREYIAIKNGEVPYDVSNYLITKIMWKLTGPLNQKRISQYDVRAGIIDTNKRLVETAEKNFLGLVAFINGEYNKFAKPTE
jgi:hypothetical protein